MATSREVATMIKLGFISNPSPFSPSRTPHSRDLISPNSKTPCSSPSPPHFSPRESNRPIRHSTLFQIMSEEQTLEPNRHKSQSKIPKIVQEIEILRGCGLGPGDVRVTVIGKDGGKASCEFHKRVLVEKSAFFREKLRGKEKGIDLLSVEIGECDDVEVYLETLVLMYYDDLKKRLLGEDVSKVLGFLKVSSDIMFYVGIMACLEYLEAMPWSEEEEEKIISLIAKLELQNSATEILQRVSSQKPTSTIANNIFSKLLNSILQAEDIKSRQEMKTLISQLLQDHKLELSKDTLYSLCHQCLSSLVLSISEATSMSEISREAENLQWIVDILIDKKWAEEFVEVWADQRELAVLHSKISIMYRHEISLITAQLCIAIGRGRILVPKETRFLLLSTWLEPLYEDFGWIGRACRSVDRKQMEDGLGRTILTLPLVQQQIFFLNWFDRFLSKGDDCPNIQRAFEVWWRRAFVRQHVVKENPELKITVHDYPS